MELHERLEGRPHHQDEQRVFPSFWVVVTQLVVLDAIFSLDSVITAVGIVTHLPVMMAAVVIAVCIMVWASRPLTEFVNKHPTVVVLLSLIHILDMDVSRSCGTAVAGQTANDVGVLRRQHHFLFVKLRHRIFPCRDVITAGGRDRRPAENRAEQFAHRHFQHDLCDIGQNGTGQIPE